MGEKRDIMPLIRHVMAALIVGALLTPQRGSAQEPVSSADSASHPTVLADGSVAFYWQPSPGAPIEDGRNVPALKRHISVNFVDVAVTDALAAVGRQSGLRFTYSRGVTPLTNRVTLGADHITVEAALTDILDGTGLDVQLTPSGLATLLPHLERGPGSHLRPRTTQGTSTIHGVAIDSVTGSALVHVTIRVDGTDLTASTGGDGRYTITGLAAGDFRVSARRVGYVAKVRPVTLAEGENKTVDFALNPPATTLDEVVTTAVGEQRRYQVGNVITTINVDSIAPTAPVTSVTDLISGRAPGVDVVQNSGLVGSGGPIRIRGQSSLVLQSDPIVIVDGIRQDNSPGGSYSNMFGYAASPSRLDDIDFTQVETIDVLKGPAASTEYGTDAANGVIVITTKHGAAGTPQWHASAEEDPSNEPMSYPQAYYSWGHTTNGVRSSTQCTLIGLAGGLYAQYGFPENEGQTEGTCVADSITHFQPLDHAAYSMFGTGTRGKYDLSVSGGSDALRYFVAGNASNETGMTHVPNIFRSEADAIGLPASAFNPNTEQQRSVRVNTTIRLGATADLSIASAYLVTNAILPGTGNLSCCLNTLGGQPPDSANDYGWGVYNSAQAPYNGVTPLSNVGQLQSQQTSRLTGGMTANWHPTGWLLTHLTVGIDHGSQQLNASQLPQSSEYTSYGVAYTSQNPGKADGSLYIQEGTTDIYSADFRVAATAAVSSSIRAVTSLGLQMASTHEQGDAIDVYGTSPTNLSLNGSFPYAPNVSQTANQSGTLGGYVEEQVGLDERLFVNAALRVDAGSGFGGAYNVAAYQKLSVSWLAITNSSTSLRFRGAFGANGQQPQAGAALQLAQLNAVYVNGAATNGSQLMATGNPNLQPERSQELEGGVDLGLWGNRLSIEFTAYQKETQKTLVDQSLGFDLNSWSIEENLGEVRNSGLEATVSATMVQTRVFDWELTLNASANHNLLVNILPTALQANYTYYFGGAERQVAGYPLYSYWGQRYSYADVNHDGIIEESETSLDTTHVYVGQSLPAQEVSLGTHVGFWRGAVTIGALFDYQGGYRVFSGFGGDGGSGGGGSTSRAEQNVIGQPTWLQAADAVDQYAYFSAADFANGAYVRFRELSFTYALPRRLAHAIRVHDLSLTGAVRNLKLWTNVNGGFGDPEVTSASLGSVPNFVTGGSSVNNDFRLEAEGVPLARYWMARLNIGL